MPNFSYNVLIHRQQFGYGGVNGIRQATPICLGDYFFKYSHKSLKNFFLKIEIFLILLCQRNYVKDFQKYSFSKFWNRIYKSFLCLKTTITMFKWVIWRTFYSLDIFQFNSHVAMIYWEPYNIKKKLILSTPN